MKTSSEQSASQQTAQSSASSGVSEEREAASETMTIEVPPSAQPTKIKIHRATRSQSKEVRHQESQTGTQVQTESQTSSRLTASNFHPWRWILGFGVVILIIGQIAARTGLAMMFPWLRFFDVLRFFGK